ncbi:MAG: DUF3289 family protein [Clostridiales bacterium]|nr:DUF3289 family protein [Clostridiales bacterium]
MKVSWNKVDGATIYQLLNGNTTVYRGSDTYYEVGGLTTGETYTFKVRAYNGVSTPALSEPCTVTVGLVEPLLIYQTRDTELNWFETEDSTTETLRPDLLYADMTKDEIIEKTSIDIYDFLNNSLEQKKNCFKNMAVGVFASETFKPIISDMIEHYYLERMSNFTSVIDGYYVYENEDLTNQVKLHEQSVKYVYEVKAALDRCLKSNNGNIDEIEYYPSLRFEPDIRSNHPMVYQLAHKPIPDSESFELVPQPVFNSKSDIFEGFTISLDSLQGNKIEILSYSLNGNNYNGTMRVTYYDHFGLDINDLSNGYPSTFKSLFTANIDGFRQWFILQHWIDLRDYIHITPFVTLIQFDIPFNGTII